MNKKYLKSRLLSNILSFDEIKYMVESKMYHKGRFKFQRSELSYFFHSYHNFGCTERSIEIPIIGYYLRRLPSLKRVLEIGNVTQHYHEYFNPLLVDQRTDIVDKYEEARGVTNQDICDFKTPIKYDFIFSISTFEHMDSDAGNNKFYEPNKSKLVSVAADNIKYVYDNLLADGGKFIITAPLDYTPEWKDTFYCPYFESKRFLYERIGEINWKEILVKEGQHVQLRKTGSPINYLTVMEFVK